MPTVQEKFGQLMREIRLSKGISQEKLADLAGLHRTYVSSVERGERNISIVNIEKIAKGMKVTMREIIPE